MFTGTTTSPARSAPTRGPQPVEPVRQLDRDAVPGDQPERGEPRGGAVDLRRPVPPRSAAAAPRRPPARPVAAGRRPDQRRQRRTCLGHGHLLRWTARATPSGSDGWCVRARWRGRAGAMLSPWGLPRSTRGRRPAVAPGRRRSRSAGRRGGRSPACRTPGTSSGRPPGRRRCRDPRGRDAPSRGRRPPRGPTPTPSPRTSTGGRGRRRGGGLRRSSVRTLGRRRPTPASPPDARRRCDVWALVRRAQDGDAEAFGRALRPLRDDGPPVRLPPGRRPGDGRGRHQRDLRAGAAPDRLAVLPGPRRRGLAGHDRAQHRPRPREEQPATGSRSPPPTCATPTAPPTVRRTRSLQHLTNQQLLECVQQLGQRAAGMHRAALPPRPVGVRDRARSWARRTAPSRRCSTGPCGGSPACCPRDCDDRRTKIVAGRNRIPRPVVGVGCSGVHRRPGPPHR